MKHTALDVDDVKTQMRKTMESVRVHQMISRHVARQNVLQHILSHHACAEPSPVSRVIRPFSGSATFVFIPRGCDEESNKGGAATWENFAVALELFHNIFCPCCTHFFLSILIPSRFVLIREIEKAFQSRSGEMDGVGFMGTLQATEGRNFHRDHESEAFETQGQALALRERTQSLSRFSRRSSMIR